MAKVFRALPEALTKNACGMLLMRTVGVLFFARDETS